MPSQDVLEKLFKVERNAEALVAEARAEGDRRVAAVKAEIERSYTEACEAAAKAAAADRETAEKVADDEYRAALESYRARLEAALLDEKAFREACELGLSGVH